MDAERWSERLQEPGGPHGAGGPRPSARLEERTNPELAQEIYELDRSTERRLLRGRLRHRSACARISSVQSV